MNALFEKIEKFPLFGFLAAALMITLIRIILLFTSQLNLGPDETQYWYWAQTPAFGYFSKPPMIAWVISATTSVFGDAEWAVRLSSPLFHLGTAFFLFATTAHLFDRKIAFWVGTGWLLMPGIAFSSALITTDVPLLFFWSGALYFFARILVETKPGFDEPSLGLGALLGAFIGLGFLSKYAMIYFVVAMTITVLVSKAITRKRVWQTLSIAITLAVFIFLPNVLWNADNNFQTLSHTAANANWGADMFHPEELGEFLSSQIAIGGPIVLGAFIAFLIVGWRNSSNGHARLLLAFALNPLFIVSVQAILSRAHANWAATAYPAVIIIATVWLYRARLYNWLIASHGFNLIMAIGLSIGLSSFVIIDQVGLSNSVKRTRGWDIQGPEVAKLAQNYDVVMADDRELTGQLLYYADLSERGVRAWNSNNAVDSHYEAFHAFVPGEAQTLLYVTQNQDAIAVTPLFETVDLIGQTSVDLKRGRSRTLYMFEISGFKGR